CTGDVLKIKPKGQGEGRRDPIRSDELPYHDMFTNRCLRRLSDRYCPWRHSRSKAISVRPAHDPANAAIFSLACMFFSCDRFGHSPQTVALYETEIVEMPQVFLPFAKDAKGQTLYEKMVDGRFLLVDGQ